MPDEIDVAARLLARSFLDEPFFAYIGVDPAVRGLGVGSRLADEAVSVADATGASAFLVTFGPKTRALYERRGFIVQGGFSPVPGGPEGWAMYRPAPPSSS